jgi:hypothetical protein
MKRLLLLALALVLIAGGFWYIKNRAPAPAPEAASNATSSDPAPARVEWEGLLPEVQKTLLRESPELQVSRGTGITITEEADLTGDGITEVLVDAGVGGAYTNSLVLMEVKNGGPAVSQLRTKEGDVIHADSFLSGASVRNGEETRLIPERGGVVAFHYSLKSDGITLDFCEAEAYVWDADTGLFEYQTGLSSSMRTTYCEDLANRPQ